MRVLCLAVLMALSSAELVKVHTTINTPLGWSKVDADMDTNQVYDNVVIGMKRANPKALQQLVDDVSSPKSANYLNYPSYEQIGNMVRPSAQNTAVVKRWLAEHGIRTVVEHPHGDHIRIEATLEQLSHMSQSAFETFEHTTGQRIARATGGVRLPAEVAAVVETFSGFHGFPLNPVSAPLVKENVQAAGDVTPPFLRNTYNISAVPASGKSNIQAIAQFQGQYVRDEDLANFCKKYDGGADCKIAKYIGKDKQILPGVESMLDTEYMVPIGGAPTWVYSYPGTDFCADLIEFAGNVSSEAEHPSVISISYGSQKIDFCETSLIARFSVDVQKLAALGITVMISSGDDGSGHSTRQGINAGKLSPSYPASIPYCVAVGSTWFQHGTSGAEEATTQFGSGGGFSYDFSAPSYQTDDIATYLSTVSLPKLSYATGGRGSPDVSTLGQSFTVMWHGLLEAVGGTSASSPTFGGIVTLLNEVCLAESGKTLGFANPLFYQNPQIFRDVTKGTNAIGKNTQGWEAIKGWDASTGLGTPDFPLMVSAVKQACANARN